MMSDPINVATGCRLYSEGLDRKSQDALLAEIRAVLISAPLFTPRMPRSGKPFSVRMSNMGPLGWLSDQHGGYRYQSQHPDTGQDWPQIPERLLGLWNALLPGHPPPEACLINYYGPEARMGLHRDEDEPAHDVPILSISLGDTARFRLGGLKRTDPTFSFELKSGDVLILEPPLRLAYHGVDRIVSGSSSLLQGGGRFNLTLRRVNPA